MAAGALLAKGVLDKIVADSPRGDDAAMATVRGAGVTFQGSGRARGGGGA
jgi:hypothetical protein